MSTTPNPTPPELHRLVIRPPHWGWSLLIAIVVAITGIGLAIWLPYQRELKIVAQIEALGAKVESKSRGPDWLERLVGYERMEKITLFDRATDVKFDDRRCTDSEL